MAKYQIEVGSAAVFPWEVKGDWCEDHYQYHMQNLVGVEVCDVDGNVVRLFHTHAFLDDPEGAQRLVDRVNARGEIDSEYWGHHGFLSVPLEERLREEAVVDQHERDNTLDQYDGWLSDYRSVVGA